MLVFLPNSVRNSDVANRFALNGVHQEALAAIWTHGRILDTPNEECGPRVALRIWSHGPFARWGYDRTTGNNWTPTRAYEHRRPNNWDDTNLSWAGYQLDVQHWGDHGAVENSYPFEDLAADVRQMPTGYDALDLTRCVQFAQQNPGVYIFPRDIATLTQLLGGPQQVMYGHTDAAVARRWDTKSATMRGRVAAGLIPQQEHVPVPTPAVPVAPMAPVAPMVPVAPVAPVAPMATQAPTTPETPIAEEDDDMEVDDDFVDFGGAGLLNANSPPPSLPPNAPTMGMPMPLLNPLAHMPLLSPIAQPVIRLNDLSPSPLPGSLLQGEPQHSNIQQQVGNAHSDRIEPEHQDAGPSEDTGSSSGEETSYNGETQEEFLKAICHVWDDNFDSKF